MLVKPVSLFRLDECLDEHLSNVNLGDYTTEFVLSDDIWDKFELPNGYGLSEDAFSDLEMMDSNMLSTIIDIDGLCEIRNHDCMWAGHCGSKEHPADEFKPLRPIIVPNIQPPAKPAVNTTGRSILLKTQPQQSVLSQPQTSPLQKTSPVLPNIDSPPNSDDEEAKSKSLLQLLQDAISECDLDDDNDLYEYFEDDDLLADTAEEQAQEVTHNVQVQKAALPTPAPPSTPAVSQFTNDHCYHKDKNASMRINNLGIETPSDSEEEIDVVSVGDKQPNRMVCALPNNPSSRDKQQLQRTMASAINKNGIKTLLPRKPAAAEVASPPQQVKRRVIEHRGVKRSKHRSPPSSPYKKRASYNHSSDSEPEPSEKRNLHNNMERQRRIDLRNAFEDLRALVPEVSKRERAPKVVILREAALYCDHLGDVSDNMQRQVEDMRRAQRRLRQRVSQLRLSLAAKHR